MRPPPPRSDLPALEAYSGSTGEDQTPTQLYMPGDTGDRIEPRSRPAHSRPRPPPSVEIPSRPSVAPPAYAHYPKIQSVPPPTSTRLQQRLPLIVLGLVALLVGAYLVMKPSGGSLIITVSGPGGRMVDGVKVLVDGEEKCSGSPCKIEGISEGAHLVRATAAGYQSTADQAVSVSAGEHTTHNVSLVKATATGIKVSAAGKGLLLYVDGREVGPLPQTVTDLEPGEHKIRVGGNPRYEDHEETLTVDPDSLKEVGPLKLKVLKGLATFKAGPGAEGAKVLVDGRRVPTLPTTIEVPAGKTRELVAKKAGYETYRRNITFEDGVAEKTFEITMVESDEDEPPPSAQAPRRPRSGGAPRAKPPAPRAAPTGQATLNMNSIPVSNVIVNGRPLGTTPKMGVSVAPGPVTVVFVHPEMGRKVQSGTVTAGATRTFMARFP